jgi:hypothetical protein
MKIILSVLLLFVVFIGCDDAGPEPPGSSEIDTSVIKLDTVVIKLDTVDR